MKKYKIFLFILVLLLISYQTVSASIKMGNSELGMFSQIWGQYATGKAPDGSHDRIDFSFRRLYVFFKGSVTTNFRYFALIANDRHEDANVTSDKPGLGLGSGFAVRSLWVNIKLADELMIQPGLMYVPFTRNFGTTGSAALLTYDLVSSQAGQYGGILPYPNVIGRGKGITLWGNIKGGLLQYRIAAFDGVTGAVNPDSTSNPEDTLHFTGRVSLNLLQPETGWYNKGTYLGKKKVLAIGTGFSFQKNIVDTSTNSFDHQAWTADVFFDYPLGKIGVLTLEAAYTSYNKDANGIKRNDYYVLAGYLFKPVNVQGLFHYEVDDVDQGEKTSRFGIGLNYFFAGHRAKIYLDYSYIQYKTGGKTDVITTVFAFKF